MHKKASFNAKEEGTYLGRAFLVAEKSKMKARFEPVTSGFASQRLAARPPGYLKSTALKNDLKQKEDIFSSYSFETCTKQALGNYKMPVKI